MQLASPRKTLQYALSSTLSAMQVLLTDHMQGCLTKIGFISVASHVVLFRGDSDATFVPLQYVTGYSHGFTSLGSPQKALYMIC